MKGICIWTWKKISFFFFCQTKCVNEFPWYLWLAKQHSVRIAWKPFQCAFNWNTANPISHIPQQAEPHSFHSTSHHTPKHPMTHPPTGPPIEFLFVTGAPASDPSLPTGCRWGEVAHWPDSGWLANWLLPLTHFRGHCLRPGSASLHVEWYKPIALRAGIKKKTFLCQP